MDKEGMEQVASVASFFVSRVDTEVDKRLGTLIGAAEDEACRAELDGLLGEAALAHARIAYQHCVTKFSTSAFRL